MLIIYQKSKTYYGHMFNIILINIRLFVNPLPHTRSLSNHTTLFHVVEQSGAIGARVKQKWRRIASLYERRKPPTGSQSHFDRTIVVDNRYLHSPNASSTAASAWSRVVSNNGICTSSGRISSGSSVQPRIIPSAPRPCFHSRPMFMYIQAGRIFVL